MPSLLLALAAALVAAPISASPIDLSTGSLPPFSAQLGDRGHSKHGLGAAYFCTGTDWTGLCDIAIQPLDTCNVLERPWRNRVASFTPAPCIMCFAYETRHCSFGSGFFWMFQFPGNATGGIGTPNNAWNTRLQSFKCWASPDCE